MKKFKVLTTKQVQNNITDYNITQFFYLIRLALRIKLENFQNFIPRAIPFHRRLFVIRKSYILYCLKSVHHFLKYYLYY